MNLSKAESSPIQGSTFIADNKTEKVDYVNTKADNDVEANLRVPDSLSLEFLEDEHHELGGDPKLDDFSNVVYLNLHDLMQILSLALFNYTQ